MCEINQSRCIRRLTIPQKKINMVQLLPQTDKRDLYCHDFLSPRTARRVNFQWLCARKVKQRNLWTAVVGKKNES